MATIESFTTLSESVVSTSAPISHSFVDVGQWMTVQFNMGGFGSRTAPPAGAGWRALADNIGFGSRRVSIYGKIKEASDGSSSTFTFDIALSSRVTIGWGDAAAPVADWVVGIAGVRSSADVISGKTVLAGDTTHTVSKSVDAPAGSLALAFMNEATVAAETGPQFYTDVTAGWTFVWQSNQTEWPIIFQKAMPTSAATGDVTVTYPNPQASNGMGIQIVIPNVGTAPEHDGTFGGSVTVGGTFSGMRPAYIPTELEVVGAATVVGVDSPYSAASWTIQRPAGAINGDMIVVPLRSQNSVGPLPIPPSDWTIATDPPAGGYTGPRTHGWFYHRIIDINSEPATYTFTQSQTLRRLGAAFLLRAPAGQIIVEDSHSPLYQPTAAGGTNAYLAAGWAVNQTPGLVLAEFGAEFTAGQSTAWDATPVGFDTVVALTTNTDPATTSRSQLWVGSRKVTASPTPDMLMDWVGEAIGPGFSAVMFRSITPQVGEGAINGTPIKVGVGGYFGGFHPPKDGAGFSSVAEFLATPGATSAHRGGSLDSPEMSDRAYSRAASLGYGVLEFSAQRTLDGVWFGCHDPNLNRTSQTTGLPDISTMTWAEVQRYKNVLNSQGAPVDYLRLDDFLAKWTPTHVVMLDPKNALAFVSEMNAMAALYGGPTKIIMKYAGAGTGQGPVARNWRDALGYQTWGYFYEPDIADGDLAAYQSNWTILGMEYQADTPAWAAVTSYGKPVMAHIAPNQTAYAEGMSKGARFVQVSGTAQVAAVGAESTPVPGGSFGSPITVGPGYVTGVAPTEEPGVIGFGRVRGLFVAGIADGPDVGSAPDIRPMTGTVTFKASVPSVRVPTGDPVPLTLFLQNIVVPLDAEGYLADANGRDISLLATDDPAGTPVGWKWTATFALQYAGKDVTAQPVVFSLPIDGLVDLSVI